eukprot:5378022-Pleurochrysis_carterae.AAC.2
MQCPVQHYLCDALGDENRKSVKSQKAVPLKLALPTSAVFIQYRIARRQNGYAIRTLTMTQRGGVPVRRLAMGVRIHLAAAIANRA